MAYKEIVTFPKKWEVWKRFLQNVVNFSNVKNLFFKFLKVSNSKLKVCGREFFKLLRISTLKFEKVCERKFFNLLKVLTVKFEVCGRMVFELLKASNFKRVKESSSHCCKFQVKFQDCAIKVFQVFKVFFSSLCEMSKDFFQSFQFFERMFILSFVFKMPSFQMESLKIMEKFDDGNFHLWKFKIHMMLSKHGLWKFINGSTTLPSEEVIRADYTKKKDKGFCIAL